MAKAGSVEFIVSEGPEFSNDHKTRFLIRQRAAILAATSRGLKVKTRKPAVRSDARKDAIPGTTVFSAAAQDDDEVDAASSREVSRCAMSRLAVTQRRRPIILPLLSSTIFNSSYETARSKYGVDLVELSVLVNGNVCGLSIDNVHNADTWLSTILDKSRWSYLQFVPSRYGHTDCLTKATDSLMLRMYNTLVAGSTLQNRHKEIVAHTRALKSLQAAIDDPIVSKSSDVLCASQLLSLYELLDSSANMAWAHHVRGCAQLIQHRTPEQFETEYDISLFLANVEPSVFNAAASNKHLYLEKPEWTALHMSLGIDSDETTNRSPITLQARMQLIKIVGLWVDFNDIVPTPAFFMETPVMDLLQGAEILHENINVCLEEYTTHCLRILPEQLTSQEMLMRREVLGCILTCAIIIKRLLVTVCHERDRQWIEKELHDLAQTLISHQQFVAYSGLFNNHEIAFAKSTLDTEDENYQDQSHLSRKEQLLSRRDRFIRWNQVAAAQLPPIVN